MAANPFELADRPQIRKNGGGLSAWQGGPPHLAGGGRAAPRAGRVAPSDEDLRRRLKDYVKISEHIWANIRFGTFVRYIGSDGQLRNGGFVVKNPFDFKPRGELAEKRFMKLQSSFNKDAPSHKSWLVAYEDIAYLYAKPDAVEMTTREDLRATITTLNSNIKTLATHMKKQDARISRVEGRY